MFRTGRATARNAHMELLYNCQITRTHICAKCTHGIALQLPNYTHTHISQTKKTAFYANFGLSQWHGMVPPTLLFQIFYFWKRRGKKKYYFVFFRVKFLSRTSVRPTPGRLHANVRLLKKCPKFLICD